MPFTSPAISNLGRGVFFLFLSLQTCTVFSYLLGLFVPGSTFHAVFFPSELSQGCPILSPSMPAHFLAGIIALFLFLLDVPLIESLTLLGCFALPAIPPYDPTYQSVLERITSAWYSSISSTSLSSGKHDGF